MSKEDTWLDFLVWYGREVGTMPEVELEADARTYAGMECGAMAIAELRRRAMLEAA
jgi:hypothetical protein